MTPPAIVERALAEGLDMIAVCDHNSARNAAAVQEAAGRALWRCSPAWRSPPSRSATSSPSSPTPRRRRPRAPRSARPCGPIDDGYETFFGEQRVLAADGSERARETLALATATTLDVDASRQPRARPRRPRHRRAHRPPQLRRDRPARLLPGRRRLRRRRALAARRPGLRATRPRIAVHGLPIVHSSDAHYPSDIGAARTVLHCERASFAELALALARRARQERRRCMTSRSTCSTSSRTRVRAGRDEDRRRRSPPTAPPTACRSPSRTTAPDCPSRRGAGPRSVLHHQEGQEDRPGAEPVSPGGRGRRRRAQRRPAPRRSAASPCAPG